MSWPEAPLLEVVTRHWPTDRRRILLARQQRSLATLTSHDWVQTVLVDPHGLGIPASSYRLRAFTPVGHYVWILDDDDLCIDPDLLSRIDPAADLILCRMNHCSLGVLPDDRHWDAKKVILRQVGPPCAILSRDLWLQTRHAWGLRYEGDADFLEAAARHASHPLWLNVIVAAVDQVSGGRP